MLKKILLICIAIFCFSQCTFAKSIPVPIKPLCKLSTADNSICLGDTINFVVVGDVYMGSKLYIKAMTPVYGDVVNIDYNSFACKPASIYAENFWTTNIDGKTVYLKGIVCKQGKTHWMFTQFISFLYIFIRGGEAQILPDRDTFILYLEEGMYKENKSD